MKNFNREDTSFSLCGLNCRLCPMYLNHYCPGCGGGEGNQSCAIAKCSLQHSQISYCFECGEYPCARYDGIDEYDSFITHLNRRADMQRMKEIGARQYQSELDEKGAILKYLLEHFNDGRKKTFFCVAVNLLSLEDVRAIAGQLREEVDVTDEDVKTRAGRAVELLEDAAREQDLVLKLRKKKKK